MNIKAIQTIRQEETMALRRGLDHAEEALEKQKASAGSRDYIPFCIWKDDRKGKGEQYMHILRFLPNETVTCSTYDFVVCDDKTNRTFIVPSSVDIDEEDFFVKHDISIPGFQGAEQSLDKARKEVTIAIAVEREEYTEKVDGRTEVKIRDKIVERTWKDKEGEEHTEKGVQYWIVKQSIGNFWGTLIAYNRKYRTISDRDFQIERTRNDKDTSYSMLQFDKIPGLVTDDEVNAVYKPPVDLETWIMNRLATEAICAPLLKSKMGKGSTSTEPAAEVSAEMESSPADPETKPHAEPETKAEPKASGGPKPMTDDGDEAQATQQPTEPETGTKVGGLRGTLLGSK